MKSSYDSILKFWFGDELSLLKSNDYVHKFTLWFKPEWETDELIKEKFGILFEQAERGELDREWTKNPESTLALIILLDQFSRSFYRGTSKMFSNDAKAIQLACELIENEKFEQFSPIEQYFCYMPLSHSEDLNVFKKALSGCENLLKKSTGAQKKNFGKYLNSMIVQHEILKKHGRFPHRNDLLGRKSTRDELKFLEHSKHNFVKSVMPLKKQINEETLPKQHDIKTPSQPYQKLLFLHGFRQNANKIKKRMNKILNVLKNECNAYVYFLNGTHPYKPQGDAAQQLQTTFGDHALNPIESQRIWYNSTDDSTVYQGIEESIAHVLQHVKAHGPYDGIIGFSQGSLLASLIIKQYPNLFRYFISISGFNANSLAHKTLYSVEKPFDFSSLHIFGKNDTLVTPERSEKFSKCFLNSLCAIHNAGHFAPDAWPQQKIVEFIKAQSINSKPIQFQSDLPFEFILIKLNDALIRSDLDKLDIDCLFKTSFGLNLYKSDEFINFFKGESNDYLKRELETVHNNLEHLNDKLLIVYLLLIRNKEHLVNSFNDNTPEINKYLTAILEIWLNIYLKEASFRDYLLNKTIDLLFVDAQHWREIIHLCDTSFNLKINEVYDFLIELFASRLTLDLSLLDSKNNTHLIQELITNQNVNDENFKIKLLKTEESISELANYMPRVKSSIDKHSRIGRECADRLNSYKTINQDAYPNEYKKAKIRSYNHYRKVLTNITFYLKKLDEKINENSNPRYNLFLARRDKTVMEHLMSAPLSDAIVNPIPEPVDISSREQMQPLYEWLNKNQPFNDHDLKFLRGTITTDGRLDLCKQVIGPQGILPLLESMKDNKQIDRLLLGNNVIGDNGGKAIAEFIKSGKSPLKIWYIAGNSFTSNGIKPICEALHNDQQVTGLWLKRNPLKSDGMKYIGELLRVNTKIEVLDLLNCGLLDEGIRILFESLAYNKTLKHLYLSANGVSPVGLSYIAKYLSTGQSILETLFLGCNRIGNEGAKILSQGLKNDKKLIRLNLSSSRIGADGMKYLAESLENHPNLTVFELGYMRATMDLGELGNYIEDEGALYLSKLIPTLKKLVNLSITHNHITQKGMQLIIKAVKQSESLIEFDYLQYGVSLNDDMLNDLRKHLNENKENFLKYHSNAELESILIPNHVNEIYSVYRTH